MKTKIDIVLDLLNEFKSIGKFYSDLASIGIDLSSRILKGHDNLENTILDIIGVPQDTHVYNPVDTEVTGYCRDGWHEDMFSFIDSDQSTEDFLKQLLDVLHKENIGYYKHNAIT